MKISLSTTRFILGTILLFTVNARKLGSPVVNNNDNNEEGATLLPPRHDESQSISHHHAHRQLHGYRTIQVAMDIDVPYDSGVWSDCDYETNVVSSVGSGFSSHSCTVRGRYDPYYDVDEKGYMVAFHVSPVGEWNGANTVYCHDDYVHYHWLFSYTKVMICEHLLYRGGYKTHMLCCRGGLGYAYGMPSAEAAAAANTTSMTEAVTPEASAQEESTKKTPKQKATENKNKKNP